MGSTPPASWSRLDATRRSCPRRTSCAGPPCSGRPAWVDEEQGIYRDEVMDIIGGLADISSDTLQILAILRGEDEEDEDAEEEPVDS